MRRRLADPKRCIAYVVGLTMALLGNNGAIAAEESITDPLLCAQREVLLMILIEAHGAFPNAASEMLAAERTALMLARSACENGHVRDGVAFYDRLIEKLTTSLTQKEPSTQREK